MPNAGRLEWMGKYAAILSALVATAVGIGQYRRGVSQSIRELEWKQAEMARTLINGWQRCSSDWTTATNIEVYGEIIIERCQASLPDRGA